MLERWRDEVRAHLPFEHTMNATHLSRRSPSLLGAAVRRQREARGTRRAPLEPASARRFAVALACLGVSYVLAWIELPLGQLASTPTDGASAASSTLAAALIARLLVGLLYAFVALRHAWARWLTVALGFASIVFTGPLLPAEWHVFALGACVTGLGLAGKAIAAILLALPLRTRHDERP